VLQEEHTSLLRRNQNLTIIKNLFESLLNKKPKGKMFNIVTGTWNPVTGCLYECKYCWARELATTKLKNSHRYQNGFKPMLNEIEFRSKFSKGDTIFVSDMGDLFGKFIPRDWIRRVIRHTSLFPEANFLFLTKNPQRYHEFIGEIPQNAILGATIETNIDSYVQEKVPSPTERYIAMKELPWSRKIVSIEPILDFDIEVFSKWIEDILPFLVYIGYDNYNHELKEPTQNKTLELLDRVSANTLVIKKTIRPAWFEAGSDLGDFIEQ
jgi:DNA repair photolyase